MQIGVVSFLSPWGIKYVLAVNTFHALKSHYLNVEPDVFRWFDTQDYPSQS